MKFFIGLLLVVVDLVLVIAGITCLIVAMASGVTSMFTEGLLIFGLIGIGAFVGTTIVTSLVFLIGSEMR